MTQEGREKKALSTYRLDKAKRLLDDARLLFREGRWDSTVNRSYYAALSAAKSALILFGSDPKTHEGVKTMVSKMLVMEGHLTKEQGKWFRDLLFEREDADYADYSTIDASDAEGALNHANDFIEKISAITTALQRQLTDA